jgi:hypothetical protein
VSLDQSSVATYTTQDPRSANISSNNTPQSDYGITPSSARSSGFPPEHLRYSQYSHAPHHQGAVVTMAQPTSPSMSLPDGAPNGNPTANSLHKRSNSDVPIDPSISQASPTYPPYSPYPQGQDILPTCSNVRPTSNGVAILRSMACLVHTRTPGAQVFKDRLKLQLHPDPDRYGITTRFLV